MNSDCSDIDTELNFSIDGDGKPVVLIHGFAASNQDWVYLTPELVGQGFQVIAPDLIGHGDSNKPLDTGCYTFNFLYNHFTNWINRLENGRKITMVGHSMGGSIALNYAIQYPGSVDQLVLINPFFNPNQLNSVLRYINKKPSSYQKVLQRTPQWLIHTLLSLDVNGWIHYEDRTRQQIAEDYKRASPDIVYIPGSIPDISTSILDIQVPTLVIWGTRDITLNPQSFPQMVASLPNGYGKAIQGIGHQPHLARPEEVNQYILDFLQNRSVRSFASISIQN